MPLPRFNAATLLLLALIATSCNRPHQIQVGWRPIATFSGSGSTQTDSFNIESGEWRIKWTAAASLRVEVHSAISGRPLMVAIDHKGPGRDVAYIHEDPRLYHLVVDSPGPDWTLTIEEAVVGY